MNFCFFPLLVFIFLDFSRMVCMYVCTCELARTPRVPIVSREKELVFLVLKIFFFFFFCVLFFPRHDRPWSRRKMIFFLLFLWEKVQSVFC